MATLDQLSRDNQIKVLDNLRYALSFQERMKYNYKYVADHMNARASSTAKSGWILYGLVAVINVVIAFPLIMILLLVSMLFVEGRSTSDPLVFLVFGIAFLVFLAIMIPLNVILIKKTKKSNLQRRKETVKFNDGLAPYLPFYQEKYALAQTLLNTIYKNFCIHDRLKNINVLNYVISELQSSSRITLKQATDDFYTHQYQEAMLAEATAARAAAEQMQRDNAAYQSQMLSEIKNVAAQQEMQVNLERRIADIMYLRMV